jgi:hypothetical protein
VTFETESDLEFDAAGPFAVARAVWLGLDGLPVRRETDPLADHLGGTDMARSKGMGRIATGGSVLTIHDIHYGEDVLVAKNHKVGAGKVLRVDD